MKRFRGPKTFGEWVLEHVFWIGCIAQALLIVAVLGVVGYVAHHFIAKWW